MSGAYAPLQWLGFAERELLLFAVSEEHFELRTRLGTGIEP